MPINFATGFMKGFEEERKIKRDEESRKEKAVALQDIFKNLSKVMAPREETTFSGLDTPPPSAPTPDLSLGAPTGQQMFPAAPPAPTTQMVQPDRQEIIRGIIGTLGKSSHPGLGTEAVHKLLGVDMFKPPQTKVVGKKLVDEQGNVVAEDTTSAKSTWLTNDRGNAVEVRPDGSTQEYPGMTLKDIAKAQISAGSKESVAGITAGSREKVAKIGAESRVEAARISGKFRLLSAQERTSAMRDVADIRAAAGEKIDSPAKLYTHLTKKWDDGSITAKQIKILRHLEPVIIKMGMMQTLMQQETGVDPNPAPWDPENAPTPEVQEQYSWWEKLFGGKGGGTGDEKERPDLPSGQGEVPVNPAIRRGGEPGKAPQKYKVTMTMDGKKREMSPPNDWTEAEVQKTLEKLEAAKKQGKPTEALINKLKSYGWTVN